MPNAPLRSCSQYPCPNKVASGRCPEHTRAKHKRIDERRGSSHERGYGRGWDVIRVQAFIRDKWRCVQCGWEPELVRMYREADMGLPSTRTVLDILTARFNAGQEHLHADHIKPIVERPELRLDISNVQTLCNRCHAAKSMSEMREGPGR